MTQKFYAGIGSRKTPDNVLQIMTTVATALHANDWWLRSGAAEGADKAFEKGAGVNKQIFLPWGAFNGHNSPYSRPAELAYALGAEIIPHWNKLTPGAKALHARNMHQITGPHMCDPVRFVMCWTEGGKLIGGTSSAIILAQELSVPVFNLGNFTPADHKKFQEITGLSL